MEQFKTKSFPNTIEGRRYVCVQATLILSWVSCVFSTKSEFSFQLRSQGFLSCLKEERVPWERSCSAPYVLTSLGLVLMKSLDSLSCISDDKSHDFNALLLDR